MEIKLEKTFIVLDIEATGDQINKDRIVEIGMIKIFPNGKEEVYEKRINPESLLVCVDKNLFSTLKIHLLIEF